MGMDMDGQSGEFEYVSSGSEVSSQAESLRDEFDCMDPIQHLRWARQQPTPLVSRVDILSPSQQEALRKLAQKPESVVSRARGQLQYWTQRKAALASVNRSYRAGLDAREQNVVGKLDLFL